MQNRKNKTVRSFACKYTLPQLAQQMRNRFHVLFLLDDLENLLVCASYKENKSEYCKMKDGCLKTVKLLQRPTSKSECSGKACSTAFERSDANRTAVPR